MQEYRLLIQHWGFTTLLIGLAMIFSVFKPFWQESVFLIAGGEKLYMVTLVVYNKGENFASGFVSVAAVDIITSVYLLAYLYWLKQDASIKQ